MMNSGSVSSLALGHTRAQLYIFCFISASSLKGCWKHRRHTRQGASE